MDGSTVKGKKKSKSKSHPMHTCLWQGDPSQRLINLWLKPLAEKLQ
jgi:hypothetical protein